MNKKPVHILHVSPSFWPAVAYGGPIFSTKAITDGIAGTDGFTLEVLTTDTADPNSATRLSIVENPLRMPAGYPVRYCKRLFGNSISAEFLWRLFFAIRRADVVHLTGPYNFPVIPTLVACRLYDTPLLWSPRGGFQATAEWNGAPNRKVKNLFEKLCAKLSPKDLVLHFTAPIEEQMSLRNFSQVRTAMIPNAIELQGRCLCREWRPDGRFRLAFLSRVHPKKGLDVLISALETLPKNVTLDIYGEGDSDYLASLLTKIADAGLGDRIKFHGQVDGEAKKDAFFNCDLFILPSHSENFGIVVAEALAHGTPVLTTVNVPWRKLDTVGCGRSVEATPDSLAMAIRQLENADLAKMGDLGREWVMREFNVGDMVQKFADLYQKLASKNQD